MKTLVIFYSRTGSTRHIAESISQMLDCDMEEIIDLKSRSGVLGFLSACIDALFKKCTHIKKAKEQVEAYDLVIIGTPIWVGRLSSPVRTYLSQNFEHFKKIAFFCSKGTKDKGIYFDEMEKLAGIKPIASLQVREDDVRNEEYIPKVEAFVGKIN